MLGFVLASTSREHSVCPSQGWIYIPILSLPRAMLSDPNISCRVVLFARSSPPHYTPRPRQRSLDRSSDSLRASVEIGGFFENLFFGGRKRAAEAGDFAN